MEYIDYMRDQWQRWYNAEQPTIDELNELIMWAIDRKAEQIQVLIDRLKHHGIGTDE